LKKIFKFNLVNGECRLESIFDTAPAASKNNASFKKDEGRFKSQR
jgi:hypothetical protein